MKKICLLLITVSSLFLSKDLKAQPPDCTSNISPANGSTNISPYPSVTFKWNAVSGAASYDVYVSSKTPPQKLVATVSSDSFNFKTASYNTTYYWYIVPKNADGTATGCVSSTTSFMTGPPPPPPPNDNCDGAAEITAIPQDGTTLGATQSLPAVDCGGYTGTANDDVWYGFTALENGTKIISLTGNGSFDGVLEAFSGNCGSLTSLTCSDTSQEGGSEKITLSVTAGITYKVRVYGFYGDLTNRGTFSISLAGVPLPVTLLSFSGERHGEKNILTWSTAAEINNQGFELQYATDGKDFEKRAFISSRAINGNSSTFLSYQFTDSPPESGNSFYRLRQIDKDGKESFSNIVALRGEKADRISLGNFYPNPAKNNLNISIAIPKSNKVNLRITDVAGKIVQQQNFLLVSGHNNLKMDVSALPSGSYFIRAAGNNGFKSSVSKFVKE